MNSEDIIGRYVKVNGTRIHYDELGEGIPLVLVHTLHGCSLQWKEALPLLAERGFKAVAPDLPGNSRSYPPPDGPIGSPHEMAEFIHAFGKTVFGDEKFVVSGTSIGGNITVDLTLHHSEDLIAAVAMEGAVYTPSVGPLHGLEMPSWFPGWQDWAERCILESLGPSVTKEQVEDLRWQHRFVSHQVSIPQAACWTDQDVRKSAGPVECPLLVVAGEYDFYMPVQLLQLTERLIPGCETRYLDGIGHYPHFEDPAQTADLISDFVKKHMMESSTA